MHLLSDPAHSQPCAALFSFVSLMLKCDYNTRYYFYYKLLYTYYTYTDIDDNHPSHAERHGTDCIPRRHPAMALQQPAGARRVDEFIVVLLKLSELSRRDPSDSLRGPSVKTQHNHQHSGRLTNRTRPGGGPVWS